MRVAIVGSGISGLAAAHLLGPHHDVVLFEAADRLGGHTNTVTVEDPDVGPIGVDTGFIVHNDRNYPNLVRLFAELGVATQPSEMSFGVHDPASGIAYRATSPRALFARRRNLTSGAMWRMLWDVPRFWRAARRTLAAGDAEVTLADFLAAHHFSDAFVDLHLVPMGAAIWSADPATFESFPAVSLFAFLDNHGLLGLGDRPRWRTVTGGSRSYVAAIVDRFSGEIRLGCPIDTVLRDDDGVHVTSPRGRETFDRVVLACHSDHALDILADAAPDEKEILGAVGFQPNRAILHFDESVLPSEHGARAAWNYEVVPGAEMATVTYDLTRLQRLGGPRRYLVSLNREDRIDPDAVIAAFDYAHPVFDGAALVAQRRLSEIDGAGGVHFCGAWAGHGFHEDGLVSALRVCEKLGVSW